MGGSRDADAVLMAFFERGVDWQLVWACIFVTSVRLVICTLKIGFVVKPCCSGPSGHRGHYFCSNYLEAHGQQVWYAWDSVFLLTLEVLLFMRYVMHLSLWQLVISVNFTVHSRARTSTSPIP